MVTIADVAKAAGVSVATVSRVMNGSASVAEPTAQVVRAAIERLAYIPNQQARNLRRSESRVILVLMPNITNPYYANVFSGINERAKELGYTLFLCNPEGREPEKVLREATEGKRCDGVILLQIQYNDEWLQKYTKQIPIVQCCEYTGYGDIPHITVDNYKAAYEATEYLIRLGHRNIGTISAANNMVSTIQRMRGYRDALHDAGLRSGEGSVTYADENYGYKSSLQAARWLLTMPNRPTAVFCISDAIALATVVAAGELGIRVPQDLSIVGFDDVIYTQMFHPYLTTVIQPCAALGSQAMELLHELIVRGEISNPCVTLPHGFIVRESTGVLAQSAMNPYFPASAVK